MDGLLERLLDTLAGLVHHPAVVHAAQTMLLRYAVGEIDAAMRAGALDESERTGLVAIEHQVLAHESHGLGGAFVELGGSGDGMPVAAHQIAHRRTGADLCEFCVLLGAQHGLIPPHVQIGGIVALRQPGDAVALAGAVGAGIRMRDPSSLACVDSAEEDLG